MASKLEHTEAHDNFVLDKKEIDDVTIGQPNEKLILCEFCESVLIPEGNATKVQLEVDLI